jgi:anaerobic ribonucleoside-triphosphate reductase activating protein
LETDTATVAEQLLANPHGIEGVSFSGGEPFQQPEALLDLLKRLLHSPLSKLAFSGYTLPELQQLPLGPEALRRLDVLVAGRYAQALHVGAGLLGSSNQQIHLLTGRCRLEDFSRIPAAEVILHADGRVTLSGMAVVRLDLGGG